MKPSLHLGRGTAMARKLIAAASLMLGLILLSFGRYWSAKGLAFFEGTGLWPWLQLSVPFIPILLIMLGVMGLTRQPKSFSGPASSADSLGDRQTL